MDGQVKGRTEGTVSISRSESSGSLTHLSVFFFWGMNRGWREDGDQRRGLNEGAAVERWECGCDVERRWWNKYVASSANAAWLECGTRRGKVRWGARVGEHLLREKGRNLCGATLDVTVFTDSFPSRKLSTTLPASQVDAVLQCSQRERVSGCALTMAMEEIVIPSRSLWLHLPSLRGTG